MPFDEDPDDVRPDPDGLLPPEDRLWRHPSELGATVNPSPSPSRAAGVSTDRRRRRTPALPILAGACLAGAVVAIGAMWVARPTKVVEREPSAARAVDAGSSATFVASGTLPTERLAHELTPAVAQIQVQHDGQWSTASAVRVDDRGTLAAAAPVVAGADQVLVVDRDGTSHPARLAGIDRVTGVAALVIDDPGGTPLGVARRVRTGEAAALIGAPGTDAGSGDEVTVAAVTIRASSLRATVGEQVLHDAIQLDREVPADAVGGALVDRDGTVLGMVVGNSTERGLGTAVAGPTLIDVTTALRQEGTVRRAALGVRATDLDRSRAARLQVDGGTRLIEVTADSPADEAGLLVDDVVTAVGDQPVEDASDLVLALHGKEPGDRVEIHLHRNGEARRTTATLGG
jgi:S1-C subfamily serine protease